MVKLGDEEAFAAAEYQLVRVDTGHILMHRQLRGVDAEHFNQQWQERGVPTRWQRLNTAAVA